jgi:hypothetical protein
MVEKYYYDPKEMSCECVDKIHLAQDWVQLVRSWEHGGEITGSIKGSGFIEYLSGSYLL